jgi:hypothetical protein
MMFEAGKKYKSLYNRVYKCLAVHQHYGWLVNVDREDDVGTYDGLDVSYGWTEYKEPVTTIAYAALLENSGGQRFWSGVRSTHAEIVQCVKSVYSNCKLIIIHKWEHTDV